MFYMLIFYNLIFTLDIILFVIYRGIFFCCVKSDNEIFTFICNLYFHMLDIICFTNFILFLMRLSHMLSALYVIFRVMHAKLL